MRPFFLAAGLLFGTLALASILLRPAATATPAASSAAPGAVASATPGTCTYAPLMVSLYGNISLNDVPPFSTPVGESFLQFDPTPPLTTAASSTGAFLLNETTTGTASGDISGTFAMNNLNG